MKISDPETGTIEAVDALSAMAHEGRLVLLRKLIQAGPEGLPAGALADAAQINPPTASAQLLVLRNAGLVRSQRQGRHRYYYAEYPALTRLLTFLVEDCCGGRGEICSPLRQVCQ